jgi:hypothetical protein
MSTTSLLSLPNFTKNLVLECNTLGKCIKVVLLQEGQLSYFTRKQLCERHLGKLTYEKEMMVILHAMDI